MHCNGICNGIKRMTMCIVLIMVGLIPAAHGQKQQNLVIDSVVFTRTGLFLTLSEPVFIREVKISQGEQELASQSVNAAGQALVDLAWHGNTQYNLEVLTDKATLTMPVYAPDKPSPVKIAEIPLEDLDKEEMEYLYYASRGADVRFSHDGKYIGVGSKGGYVYLISVESKKIVWKHKIPQARVAAVAFTHDGKLIASEESADGCVYCFDRKSGKVLWQYKTIADFGGKGSPLSVMGRRYTYYPMQVWGLSIDKDNHCYVLSRNGCEKQVKGKKIRVTNSLIYKFDTHTGKPIWKFPINGSAWGLRISADGKYVIPSMGWSKEATLSVIDSSSGKALWGHTFRSMAKNPESMRGTTGFEARISPNCRYVVVKQVFPSNTLVFDNQESIKSGQAQLLWEKKFLKVLKVAEVPIAVSSVNLELTDTTFIFATWSARAVGTTENMFELPAQHPDADTLFVYDYDGNLQWKWKLGESIWNKDCHLSENGKYMVIPIGMVPETPMADPEVMGVYVFSPDGKGGATKKLNWFFHTEGFAYKAAVSPDGKHIVVLEGPFDVDPDRKKENIVGQHRLIILS